MRGLNPVFCRGRLRPINNRMVRLCPARRNVRSGPLSNCGEVQMQYGVTPRIVCVNKATLPLGVGFDLLIAALQKYVDEHLAPVWGTQARLVRTTKPRRGDWTLLFVDTANAIRGL